MDLEKVGKFIAVKRKEQNLTQEKLAEQLGISNKSVSKWETGKCMPDWSLHKPLCQILDISINELLAGEQIESSDINSIADENILNVLKLYERMKSQKDMFIGLLLIVLGRLPVAEVSENASDVQRFFNGLSTGLSVGITLVGIAWFMYGLVQLGKRK